MKDYFDNEILTRMYRERGKEFENLVSKVLIKKEKNINSKLENKLKEICNNETEVNDIMDDIYELCNIDNEVYYKMGIADGIKLDDEIKKQLKIMDV